MDIKDFGMDSFGRGRFGFGGKKEFFDKWSEMTSEEKVEFIDKRMEAMKEMHDMHRPSVESIDNFCNEWSKKTIDEKEEFIAKKRDAMKEMHAHMDGFRGHGHGHGRGHGFGF